MFLRQFSKFTTTLEGLVPQAYCISFPRICHASNVQATGKNDYMGCEDHLSRSIDFLPVDEIISTLKAKEDLIEGSHIVSALRNLSKQFPVDKQGANSIEKLIPILVHNKKKLSGQQTLDVVGLLDQFGVEKNSKVYLDMLRHSLTRVDDLSLKNFCQLSNIILDKTIYSPVRYNLQAVLKRTFLMKLSTNIHQNDIEFYQYALRFISECQLSGDENHFTSIIMRRLCSYDDIIPLDSAMSLYTSLHSLKHSELKSGALHKVQSDLVEQAHLLTEDQISVIILEMPQQMRHVGISEYCDEKLADALARRVIEGKLRPGCALRVLSTLNKSRYKYPELIDYCCGAVINHSLRDQHEAQQLNCLRTLLPVLGAARYKSMFWDEIQDSVYKSVSKWAENPDNLVYVASRLVILGWLSNPLMEKLFDGSFRPSRLDSGSQIFCNLYQRLKLDPSYNGPLPTDSQIADLKLMFRRRNSQRKTKLYPLVTYLERGGKDLRCIRTDLKTRFFHHLDYVAAFYPDGTPAPITLKPSAGRKINDMTYMEDLMVPPGAKLVIIQPLYDFWFFKNTHELLGNFQLVAEAVERLPYPVVFVDETVFVELSESKRISFLMDKIRAKLNSAHEVHEI